MCPGKFLTKFFPKNFDIGKKYQISEPMELLELLPQNKDFYCYEGSLTTPPLLECVMWILLKQPLYLSPSTMTALRSLPCLHGGNLENNFRPPQERFPTNYRIKKPLAAWIKENLSDNYLSRTVKSRRKIEKYDRRIKKASWSHFVPEFHVLLQVQ